MIINNLLLQRSESADLSENIPVKVDKSYQSNQTCRIAKNQNERAKISQFKHQRTRCYLLQRSLFEKNSTLAHSMTCSEV